MSQPSAVDSLRGLVTPVVTPLREDAVDYDAYAGLVDRQLQSGAAGVLVNGTSGEPSTLTADERNRLVDVAIEAVSGRGLVVAATGSQSLAETEALTRHAVAAGADAVLVVTPYYVRPPQRGLLAYFVRIAEVAEIPTMIYHIPMRAAVALEVGTVAAIVAGAPNVVGMKHTVDDLGFLSQVLAELGPSFRIFAGLEELSFPMMAIGAVGTMNAVGNVLPERLVAMCDAVAANDLRTGARIHDELLELNRAVFWDTNPIAVKYMMRRLGLIASNESRLPMVAATPELERRLDELLERLEIGAEPVR